VKVLAWPGVLRIAGPSLGRLEWNEMPITLDLPPPLNEEITLEAEREGVPAADHATLLLYLASSLLRGEAPTPFQEAVKDFLSYHSLDADRVSSVFEELVSLCLAAVHDEGKSSRAFQEALTGTAVPPEDSRPESLFLPRLKAWRNAIVHSRSAVDRPVDYSPEAVISDLPPSEALRQRAGRTSRERRSAFGKYAGIIPSSEEFMREKQKEIAREDGREE
jgi:hypothetical protein